MYFPLNKQFKLNDIIAVSIPKGKWTVQFREVHLPKYTFGHTQVVNRSDYMATLKDVLHLKIFNLLQLWSAMI